MNDALVHVRPGVVRAADGDLLLAADVDAGQRLDLSPRRHRAAADERGEGEDVARLDDARVVVVGAEEGIDLCVLENPVEEGVDLLGVPLEAVPDDPGIGGDVREDEAPGGVLPGVGLDLLL